MAQTNIEQQDCPCRQIHDDRAPVRDCTDCSGTGTVDVDSLDERAAEMEQYEHWHEGQLGADQFCMACDADLRRSGRAA